MSGSSHSPHRLGEQVTPTIELEGGWRSIMLGQRIIGRLYYLNDFPHATRIGWEIGIPITGGKRGEIEALARGSRPTIRDAEDDVWCAWHTHGASIQEAIREEEAS